MSNGEIFLIKYENGDELGFEEDDEVPLVEGVLRGALALRSRVLFLKDEKRSGKKAK